MSVIKKDSMQLIRGWGFQTACSMHRGGFWPAWDFTWPACNGADEQAVRLVRPTKKRGAP